MNLNRFYNISEYIKIPNKKKNNITSSYKVWIKYAVFTRFNLLLNVMCISYKP